MEYQRSFGKIVPFHRAAAPRYKAVITDESMAQVRCDAFAVVPDAVGVLLAHVSDGVRPSVRDPVMGQTTKRKGWGAIRSGDNPGWVELAPGSGGQAVTASTPTQLELWSSPVGATLAGLHQTDGSWKQTAEAGAVVVQHEASDYKLVLDANALWAGTRPADTLLGTVVGPTELRTTVSCLLLRNILIFQYSAIFCAFHTYIVRRSTTTAEWRLRPQRRARSWSSTCAR